MVQLYPTDEPLLVLEIPSYYCMWGPKNTLYQLLTSYSIAYIEQGAIEEWSCSDNKTRTIDQMMTAWGNLMEPDGNLNAPNWFVGGGY